MSKLIAELSSNHGGDMDLAEQMIAAAAEAGADLAKVQSWRADNLRADWPDRDAALAYYRRCELSDEAHLRLADHAKRCGIDLLTTVFDIPSVERIAGLGWGVVKIGSADMTSWRLIDACLEAFSHVLISTGMHDWDEVQALHRHLGARAEATTVLHCVSLYPCPPEHVNMLRLGALMRLFPSVGYSDHTLGTEAAKLAISLGAACVERHFTTDRSLPGKDQHISSTPAEFAEIAAWRMQVQTMMHDAQAPSDLCARGYIGKWGGGG